MEEKNVKYEVNRNHPIFNQINFNDGFTIFISFVLIIAGIILLVGTTFKPISFLWIGFIAYGSLNFYVAYLRNRLIDNHKKMAAAYLCLSLGFLTQFYTGWLLLNANIYIEVKEQGSYDLNQAQEIIKGLKKDYNSGIINQFEFFSKLNKIKKEVSDYKSDIEKELQKLDRTTRLQEEDKQKIVRIKKDIATCNSIIAIGVLDLEINKSNVNNGKPLGLEDLYQMVLEKSKELNLKKMEKHRERDLELTVQ